jgi:hypothetical protein
VRLRGCAAPAAAPRTRPRAHKARGRAGDAATLAVNPDGSVTVSQPSSAGEWQRPEWGQYRQRGEALGVAIMVGGRERACCPCWLLPP